MHEPHLQLIETFYAAFARLDDQAMSACYGMDVSFDDEVFSLRGRHEVAGMWRMLCDAVRAQQARVRESGGDAQEAWTLSWSEVAADEYGGQAHWEAIYTFGQTGRRVHNRIDARFGFGSDGLIAVHRDQFDFAQWARQALGLPGLLFGRTPWLRRKVRAQAAQRLARALPPAPPDPRREGIVRS